MNLARLCEMAPRSFAIVYETLDDDGDPDDLTVVGWGLQMTDRTIFVRYDSQADDRPEFGLFNSAESVLQMVELMGPAQLLWMDSPVSHPASTGESGAARSGHPRIGRRT